MDKVLEALNILIREEHGNRITIDSLWVDARVDSFGTTMVFADMDSKYECFSNEWFRSKTKEEWMTLTIREIVERVLNESTKL